MRLHTLLLTLLSCFLTFTRAYSDLDDFDSKTPSGSGAETTLPESITLQKWPLDARTPSPLGQVGYNPKTKQGKYFSLDRSGKPVEGSVRVGFQTVNGGWIGTVVDGKALDQKNHNPIITIRIDRDGKVFHVEFATTTDTNQPPKVIVLPATDAGPTPHLNKPIVVGADGKIPQPPVEKTLLQKYWWVILAGMILLLSGSGGGE